MAPIVVLRTVPGKAVFVQILISVAFPPENANTDHGQIKVLGRLKNISGQYPQAAWSRWGSFRSVHIPCKKKQLLVRELLSRSSLLVNLTGNHVGIVLNQGICFFWGCCLTVNLKDRFIAVRDY